MRSVALRLSRTTTFWLSGALASSLACGEGSSGDAAGDAESGESSSSATQEASGAEAGVGTDEASGPTSAESEAEAEAESGDETGNPAATPAVGINIDLVTTNQGTLVDIAAGDAWVDGANRRTVIVGERDTLVQVHHSVDSGWMARELEARLHLFDEAGDPVKTLTQRLVIGGNSSPMDLDSGFSFGLVAAEGEAASGMQFQVEIVEIDEAPGGLSEGVWQSPSAGPNFIGFEGSPLEMNVVFVPITYNGFTVTLSDADKLFLENAVLEQNPLQKIEATYHAPVAYDEDITDLGQLLETMSDLRGAEDNQFTNIYYAALVRVNYPGGVAGIAQVASASVNAERISANVWYDTGNSDTVVHELGHNQGLSHVACPSGNSAGNDDSYPDPEGRIMQYGFGIKNFDFHPASEFDYMTYCGPSWVSDWTWGKTFFRILALTAWDYDYVLPPKPTTMLKGLVLPSGQMRWWTGPGSVDAELLSGNHTFRFDVGGETVEQLGEVHELSDGGGLWIETELPAGASLEGARYVGPSGELAIELR